MAVTPYQLLANWPAAEIPGRPQEYEQLASYWGAYNTLYDEIQRVLDDPSSYSAASIKQGCVTVDTALGLSHVARLALEDAHDEVLLGLRRLTAWAAHCSENEDPSEFPEDDFRSPYAYRIQLPLPKAAANSAAADRAISPVSYQVADTAARRCELSPDNPGCLTNTEIRRWGEKAGMRFMRLADNADRDALERRLFERVSNPVTCADPVRQAPAYSLESGFPAVWFDPAHEKQVKDAVGAIGDPAG